MHYYKVIQKYQENQPDFIQRHLNTYIFIIILLNMKTSEIKNFTLQSPLRPAKQKFNQTKLNSDDSLFTLEDHKNAALVCKNLKEAKQQDKPINSMVIQRNYELMVKLLKFLQQNQAQKSTNDQSKMKFRIVKSAKKLNQNLQKVEEPSSQHWQKKPIKLKPLTISQNKSEFFQNKENLICKQAPPLQIIKGKRYPQMFSLQNSRIFEPQRDRFKSQLTNEQKIRKQLEIAQQKEAQRNQENKKLRSMLLQMQNKEVDQGPMQIPLKIYLQFQQTRENPPDTKLIKIPLPQNTLSLGQKPSECQFYNQQISPLQLISVCQHKQIQNLQLKLIEAQAKAKNSPTLKKQRWNDY